MRIAALMLACAACGPPTATLAELPELTMRASLYGYVRYPALDQIRYNVVVRFTTSDKECPGLITPPTLAINGVAREAEVILGGEDEFRICREPELRASLEDSGLEGTSLEIEVDDGSGPIRATIADYLRSGSLTVVEPADAVVTSTAKVRAMWSPAELAGVRHDTARVELRELDGSGQASVSSRDLLFEGTELRFSMPGGAIYWGPTALTLLLDWSEEPADTCTGAAACTFTQRVPGTAVVEVR